MDYNPLHITCYTNYMNHRQNLPSSLLTAWTSLFLLYVMVAAWASSGPNALAGPSTPTDNAFAVMWVGLATLQFILAVLNQRRYNPMFFWVATAMAIVMALIFFAPLLGLLLTA